MHQGGEMNRRVKIDRLVYLNKVYAIDGQFSLSGSTEQFIDIIIRNLQ